MHTARLRRVLIALTTLLLTGCSHEPDPQSARAQAPKPTVSASPSSDATVAEPERAPETPKQYLRRWAAASQQMQVTGDSAAYRVMSSECPNCLGLADRVDRTYEAGGYIKTKGWRVLRVVAEPSERRKIQVYVSIDGRPTTYKESRRAKVTQLKGGPQKFRFVLHRNLQSWDVLAYFVAAES